MTQRFSPAPPWRVIKWFNTDTPLDLESLRGKVIVFGFPVGIDRPSESGPLPDTMHAYAMQGTPTLALIDAAGRLRAQHFGQVGDLALGAQIAGLLAEANAAVDIGSSAFP